jgi:hypothetical protein
MDESGVRALLDQVAADELPPVAVSIGMATSRGRRELRWRRISMAGLPPLAAAAAVVGIVAVVSHGAGNGHAGNGSSRPAAPAASWSMTPRAPVTPVREFSPLRPYATFGWLPPGYSISGHLPSDQNVGTADFPDGMTTDADQLVAVDTAAQGTKYVMLNVAAAGNCKLKAARHKPTLNCYNGMVFMTLAGPAPRVDSLPAYWDTSGNLAWEYAPHSWAQLIVNLPGAGGTSAPTGPSAIPQSAAGRAIEVRIASGVNFGGTATRPVFPFQLTGVAAGWSVLPDGQSAYGTLDNRLVFTGIALGPAADRDALSVTVQPAGEPDSGCVLEAGESYVTVDGTRAVLSSTANTGKDYQYLCVGDVHGLQVQIGLELTVEGSNDVPVPGDYASAVAVFSHLKLLGPSPANWTTNPLP